MSQLSSKQLLYPLSGSFTGSLLGSASYATTASYALNGGTGGGSSNLIYSGSVTASVSTDTSRIFAIYSGSTTPILRMNDSGTLILPSYNGVGEYERYAFVSSGSTNTGLAFFGNNNMVFRTSGNDIFKIGSTVVTNALLAFGSQTSPPTIDKQIDDSGNYNSLAVTAGGLTKSGSIQLLNGNVLIAQNASINIPNYRLQISGTGTSGSFNANGTLIVSASNTIISGSQFTITGSTFVVIGNPSINDTLKNAYFLNGQSYVYSALNIHGPTSTVAPASNAVMAYHEWTSDVARGGGSYRFRSNAGQQLATAPYVLGEDQYWGAYNTSGLPNFSQGAYIRVTSTQKYIDTSSPAKISFGTTPSGSTTPIERLVINDNGAVAITGSLSISGSTIIQGNLLPGGPYSNNTSSFTLGSPTAAWKDLYIGPGTLVFLSGSASSSISLGPSNTLNMSASVFGTASYALTASFAPSYVLNSQTASFIQVSAAGTNQTISGSLTINQNLTVLGTQSVQYITSSQLNISTNIITVNTNTPSVNFGGLAVIDSGSIPQRSGSLLFDSVADQWIFVHQSSPTITSSVLIMGPETYGAVGNETNLTNNRIPKSVNAEHIGDSNITDTGTYVSINSNTQITGSLSITGSSTASGGVGRGVYLTPTIVASANNNILSGLEVTPTFTNGAFTGVANYAARFTGGQVSIETNSSTIPFLIHKFGNAQTFSIMRDGNYGTMIGSWDGATSTRCITLINNSVSIGSTGALASTAVLDVSSTTKGFLVPRMTSAQKTSISAPAQGLQVYDTGTTTEGLWYYNSGSYQAWTRALNDSGSQVINGSLTLTGSLVVSGSSHTIIGTLNATSSQAVSSSYALTASYALNAGGAGSTFPYTGIASISGSLEVTGSTFLTSFISGSVAANNPSSSILNIGGTIVSPAGITGSSAILAIPIMSASANNQTLVALDVSPRLVSGSFTGLSSLAGRFNGNVLMGQVPSSLIAYTYVPLTLCNNLTSGLKTQLALVNGGGNTGAGSAIDFFTYTDAGNGNPAVRIAGIDDGNFSNNFQILTKAQGSSGNGALTTKVQLFGGTGNLFVGTSPTDAGYKLDVNGTGRFQSTLNGTVGSFTTVMGATQFIGSSGFTAALTYKTTNAGGSITPEYITATSANTAGNIGVAIDRTNSLSFIINNGTANIARAAIQASGSNNTAGAEAGDLLFLTQTGGTAMSEKMRISGTGTITITGSLTVTGSTTISGSSLKIDIPTKANGYVLTSDASGNATWQAAGAGSAFPYTGSASISGSLSVNGPTTASLALISGSGTQRLVVVGSGSALPIFSVQGASGELFSITDSLSGSLFSVSDISGLPILETFSDSTTLMGSYLAPALYTTTRVTSIAGVNTIYSVPTASYDGIFVDYTVRSGSNARAGQMMAMWSASVVNFTETTTTDFGTTTGVTFGASISGSNMIVSGSTTTAGWTIKSIIRSI